MSSKMMSQHKRMAGGDLSVGFAKGGTVKGPSPTPTGAGKMVPSMKGVSPLTTAKTNNGIPGMKKGGKACE